MSNFVQVDENDVIVLFGSKKDLPGVHLLVEIPAAYVVEAVVDGKICGAYSIAALAKRLAPAHEGDVK